MHIQVHGGGAPRIARPRHELLQPLRRRFDRLCGTEHFLLDEVADVPACLGEGLAFRDDRLNRLR